MMIRTLVLTLILLSMIAVVPASAQTLPPAILTFDSDVTAITVADAEAETVTAQVSWQTVGMTNAYGLRLESYRANAWTRETTDVLQPVGRYAVTVRHSLTFAPPTYRLVIVDGQSQVVDERILVIRYAPPPGPAAIRSFTAGVQSLTPADFSRGSASVPVQWEIENRTPTTNLQFEQVLPDGTQNGIELPRPIRWIASSGEGMVVPVLPDGATAITIQLTLVDLATGTTVNEAAIDLPVTESAPPSTAPAASVPSDSGGDGITMGSGLPPEMFANITPQTATYGDMLTIRWRMPGISRFAVEVSLGGAAPVVVLDSDQSGGTATYVLPAGTYTEAVFSLVATGATGTSRRGTVTVTVR